MSTTLTYGWGGTLPLCDSVDGARAARCKNSGWLNTSKWNTNIQSAGLLEKPCFSASLFSVAAFPSLAESREGRCKTSPLWNGCFTFSGNFNLLLGWYLPRCVCRFLLFRQLAGIKPEATYRGAVSGGDHSNRASCNLSNYCCVFLCFTQETTQGRKLLDSNTDL